MLGVRPNELIFHVSDPKAPVTQILKLTNTSFQLVGYKVKTTAPKRYKVRPNIGYLEAGASVDLKVALTVAKEPPPKLEHEDKFQIESFDCKPFSDVPITISSKEEKSAFLKKASEGAKSAKKQKLTCKIRIEDNMYSEDGSETAPAALGESVYYSPESSFIGEASISPSTPEAQPRQSESAQPESTQLESTQPEPIQPVEPAQSAEPTQPIQAEKKKEALKPEPTVTEIIVKESVPAPTEQTKAKEAPQPTATPPSTPVTPTKPTPAPATRASTPYVDKSADASPVRATRPNTTGSTPTSNATPARQRNTPAPATLTTTAAAKLKPTGSPPATRFPNTSAAHALQQRVPNAVEINFVFVLVAFLAGYVFAKIF